MTGNHLQHNRPVHLARMLSCYERAMDLVFQPSAEADTRVRMLQADQIVKMLEKAAKHAQFSILSGPSLTEEKEFFHFLKLNRQSALAIRSMLQNEAELKAEEGFVSEFLVIAEDECAMSAMHYQRRSLDLIEGLGQMMRLAQKPYFLLKQKVMDSMSEEDRARFERAVEEVGQELRPPQKAGAETVRPLERAPTT